MSPDPDPNMPSTERRIRQRRQKRVPWAFKHDRRSGFDRRADRPGGPITQALRELRDRRYALPALLVAINVLNVVDLLLTLVLLGDGASEANPVMRVLLGGNPALATIVKVGVIAAVTAELWRQRRYRVILATAVIFFGVFVALTAWEVRLLMMG